MKKRDVKLIFFTVFLFLFTFAELTFADDMAELFFMVKHKDIGGIEKLLSTGMNVNAQTKEYGITALMMACNLNYQEVAELLLLKGADVNVKSQTGATALMMASYNSKELVELLLSKGADINAVTTSGPAEGYSSLMMATRNNKYDVAKLLISKGANVNTKSKDGSTALQIASRKGYTKMTKLLKEHGAEE